ncbi:WD40-repeat-containing domain protein [Haematococcus lacustris]
MTLRGHKGPVRQVVISPNGADVITVSEDGTAQMWDMNVGDCVMQLARDQPLTAVAVAPGGSLACVACGDGNSCVWQLSSGKVLHVLQGHSAKVNAVSIDRQGLRCVTTSDDHTVRVWNLVSGCCEQVLQGHGVAAYGVVFDVAISADGSLAATVSEDFSCRVWDLDSEEGLHVLEGHSGWVMSVSFIGTKTDIVTASHDGTARVWDGHLGRCLHVLSGHSGRLNRVCVDPGGSYAITCSDDSTARVWDLDTGHCMSVLQGHGAWVSDAVITRDGRKAVTVGGDGLGRVWDVATGQLQLLLEGHSGPIRSVVMTSRGRFAVTASDDCSARVWDLLAPMPRPDRPQQQGSRVKALAPLPGGSQVVVACEDGRLSCWQAGSGVMEWRSGPEGHTSSIQYLGVCNSSGKVVTGSGDRRVCCWEAGSGRALYGLQEQQGSRVKHMAFNADVSRVAIVLYDSSISVWEVESGTLVAQLMGRAERSGRNVHSGGVNGVLLTADGRRAVSWSKDCTARVWDVDSCQVSLVLSGHQDGLRCAALSSDESMVATASYLPCVRIHNLLDGSPLAALDHEAPATACCFSPSTSHLAVVLDNFQVVLWDLVGHRCLPPLAAHKADVTAVTFSPDSSMLVSCSMDCTVRVWDTAAGRQLAFFMGDAALTSLCFAGFPYADIIVAGDAGGCLHFLDCPPELQPLNCQNY